ncbi:MAG: type I phosphomannose isomerase catalytic subunit [Lachnospiraceae bacterium]
MADIIWLEPVHKEMIWGSESWAISAHPHGDCKIVGGNYQGMTLSQLWDLHPELFGQAGGSQFPLLVKIIEAKEDLSIQVHPDDTYAAEHESGSLGKTECWYILDCEDDAQIVIGHHAADKSELETMILEQHWDDLIRVIPVKKGDFFQIDPGCLHAIKGGTLILETQQSSDITYRVYDYDRLTDGQPRQLHVQQSIDVIRAPYEARDINKETTKLEGAVKSHFVSCPFYQVDMYQIDGSLVYDAPDSFTNVTVIEGQGYINGAVVEKGVSFIIPAGVPDCILSGNMTIICSHP